MARKLVAQASLFAIVDDTLYYIDPKCNHQQRASRTVPQRSTLWDHEWPFLWETHL